MFIVSYDFNDNKKRARFSKFLKKYGRRIQYSVYEIKNSKRFSENILKEIEMSYKKDFTKADSIVIFMICDACKTKISRFGYAKNEEKEILFF